ncbi:MAG: metallopeptidase family protein [Planctomycetota bacterium]
MIACRSVESWPRDLQPRSAALARVFPTLGEFEDLAAREFERIPAQYRSGIVSLTINEGSERHPTIPDWFTLGYCQAYLPSLYAGEDAEVTSEIVLFYGSFKAIALRDDSFDVDAELWETLTHELRHHLEQRAGIDDLDAEDYALEHDQRRRSGLEFDPAYYRAGEELDAGVYRVDLDLYLEIDWGRHEWTKRSGTSLTLTFEELEVEVTVPEMPASGPFFEIAGESPFERGRSSGEVILVWIVRGGRLER